MKLLSGVKKCLSFSAEFIEALICGTAWSCFFSRAGKQYAVFYHKFTAGNLLFPRLLYLKEKKWHK